jgi:hypothetical protein
METIIIYRNSCLLNFHMSYILNVTYCYFLTPLLQKKIVRLIAGVKPRNSCRSLFKRLEILALPCEYIFSLMNFLINNQEHFQTNSAIHSVNTGNKNQLHRPIANFICFQKSAYYAGIGIFNSLPSSLPSLINTKAQFKVVLRRYLITHSFYSVDEFLMFTSKY